MNSFLSRHAFFFLILAMAVFLRFHDISRHMIFIGDQGRDFLVARSMIEQGKIPLLGIPSSIPRFAQGPLYIYFLAFVYWLSDGSVLATGILSASFGVLAIIAMYIFVGSYLGWRRGTLSALMFTFLPMAILHSRMPYHINPIPFFTILFLWQLVRLYHQERWSGFTTGLAFALLFQFELAVFPAIFLIPLVCALRQETFSIHKNIDIFKRSFHLGSPMQVIHLVANASSRLTTKRELISVLCGLILGLSPQVIYDFTHGFSQLGGFVVWIVYRLASTILPFTRNTILEVQTPGRILELIKMYLTIFTQNQFSADQLFWAFLIPVCIAIVLARRRWAHPIEHIAVIGFSLLAVSFTLHRVASEAYMPILIPFALIILTSGISSLKKSIKYSLIVLVLFSLISSVSRLEQSAFFLLQPYEVSSPTKRFGPSIQTQHQLVRILYTLSGEKCIDLESEERDRTFATSFDHLEYLLAIEGKKHPGPCVQIQIDPPASAQKYWENPTDIIDVGTYWIRVRSEKLYAKRFTM